MLVFNCSKAATEFFTVIKKGEKFTCIESAPHKTIAESIAATKHDEDDVIAWHWLVHVVTVKRKKVVIVMEFNSRFSMTFTGLKKGDEIAFLNMFEHHLSLHVNELMQSVIDDVDDLEDSLAHYDAAHFSSAFHQRGDRSVQATLNDVAWHIDCQAHDNGYLPEDYALIKFDAFVNQLLRKNRTRKDYFQPNHEFLSAWLNEYSEFSKTDISNKIKTFKKQESSLRRQEYAIDVIKENSENNISKGNISFIASNIVSLDSFRKK